MRKFYKFLTNPDGFCGKHVNKIVVSIFAILFFTIFAIVKLNPVTASATSPTNVNEVRMASVEYVFTFASDVDTATRESITNFVYSSVDSVKLLHMVNMRQHVVFGNYNEVFIIEDTVYCPINANVADLESALEKLP